MKTINRSLVGMYHKESRLHWYAVALVGRDGEPFIVAAKTPGKAISLARYHTAGTKLVAERIDIRKGSIKPRN